MTALDIIKCLKQVKLKRLLLTWEPISELPSNISTRVLHVCSLSWVNKSWMNFRWKRICFIFPDDFTKTIISMDVNQYNIICKMYMSGYISWYMSCQLGLNSWKKLNIDYTCVNHPKKTLRGRPFDSPPPFFTLFYMFFFWNFPISIYFSFRENFFLGRHFLATPHPCYPIFTLILHNYSSVCSSQNKSTVCLRSSDQFSIVSYYIKWVMGKTDPF